MITHGILAEVSIFRINDEIDLQSDKPKKKVYFRDRSK